MAEQYFDAIILNPVAMEIGRGRVYWGHIYSDGKKRWPDGTDIRTSLVEKEFEVDGRRYIKTMNTIYKVGKVV